MSVEEQASPPTSTPWVPVWGGAGLAYKGDWAAGTFLDGDVVVKDGIAYLCVGGPTAVAPDPAPWGAATPTKSAELAYVERTTDVPVAAATQAAADTILTLPAVMLDGQTAIEIEFYTFQVTTPPAATAATVITLWDGSTDLGTIAQPASPTAASMYLPVHATKRFTPAAGAHTFSIRAWRTGGVNGNIGAGSGVPIWARIKQPSSPIPISPGASIPVAYGTTLPVGPVDGQEAILVDSLTNPSYQWRLRYNAGSASAYKWELVGGAPANSTVATSETTGSSSFVDLATAGPQFTLPRAGDYDLEYGAEMYSSQAGTSLLVSPKKGAATTADADAATGFSQSAALNTMTPSRTLRVTGMAASDVIKLQYHIGNAGTATFRNRWLRVRPVRVS